MQTFQILKLSNGDKIETEAKNWGGEITVYYLNDSVYVSGKKAFIEVVDICKERHIINVDHIVQVVTKEVPHTLEEHTRLLQEVQGAK